MSATALRSAHPSTLVAALEALAQVEDRGLAVYDRRGRKRTERSYAEGVRRARAWGTHLRAQGVAPGEVLFICLQTSHDLVESFLGASLLGALPCLVALPRAVGGLELFRRRLELIGGTFPGGHLLTTEHVGAELERSFLAVPPELPAELLPLAPVDPEALAYVQLTSGSTTTPKAVAISHGNLAANTWGIFHAGGDRRETYVSWLPLYHDMGLVGMLFTGLFQGSRVVLMPTDAFVGTPIRWLEAIAAEAGQVTTTAPNFAYQWCVDRIRAAKLEGLDLSNWRVACCGAEMVRPETMRAFAERFAAHGFRSGAFVPCYGMAENTLAATFSPPGRPLELHAGRISCGPCIDGVELSIRDENGQELPEGEEGEIVLQGSSLFQGYYANEAATAAAHGPGGFHTGDLGFVRAGELYVTGRLKDLLILDGVNVAPYELEWIAETHIETEGGRAAAFSVELAGREQPVLVVEVRAAPAAELRKRVLGQVAQDFAPLHDLVFVRRGTLPKTSSGKVRRRTVQERYATGDLEVLWSLRAEVEPAAEPTAEEGAR